MERIEETLLRDIEAWCAKHGVPVSEFGARALGSRSFVGLLRRGQDPRASTINKCREFMELHP
jgi:hypothetical protein